MKQILILLSFFIIIGCQAQKNEKFNLGFEIKNNKDTLSDGWIKWGNYDLSIDPSSHSGEKSGKISSDELGSSFGSIAYKIPAKYKGSSIRLEGYMKIKNVEKGYAGLLLRIDGNSGSLAFDNMKGQDIKGTIDWKKYSIRLKYPEGAENIFVAGILVGKGEAWFDDFVLTIDGENVQNLKEVERVLTKAELDKEFDKGSLIEIADLTTERIDNLELLAIIWGFLKYHHPAIAEADYNWDYELFRFLPPYLKATTQLERNKLIVDWIDKLGDLKKYIDCKAIDKSAFLRPDLKWIDNQEDILKEKLLSVYKNRHQGKQFYIKMKDKVGNPQFSNENSYSYMPYPDAGFRLLSLYRYWNMINYYFPSKHITDKDWNLVLKEYIPIFLNAKDELEYEFAAIQLIGEIQDTHANLRDGGNKINEWKGEYYPPVHLRFIEDQLVVTDFYNPELKSETGLQIGDIITEINGKSVKQLVKEKSNYYPASNQSARLRDMSADLLRSNSDRIDIKFIKEDATELSKSLQLYPRTDLNIYRWYKRNEDRSYKMLDNNIGYVTLQSITNEDIPEIKKAFRDTKGIIIDIRNYPSTFVPFKLGSYFVSSAVPFVKFTNANINTPGEFTTREGQKIPSDGKTYNGKLVVLVNELSQSQAEYTAMAFRAGDNTTIIGSTTAGADGNVSTIYLPGGLKTKISGIGVYYPDGKETQRIGIVPDVKVEPTIDGIRKGKDEVLDKAIDLILKE